MSRIIGDIPGTAFLGRDGWGHALPKSA